MNRVSARSRVYYIDTLTARYVRLCRLMLLRSDEFNPMGLRMLERCILAAKRDLEEAQTWQP